MQVVLVSDDGEEAGLVELKIHNTIFSAMNCLGYGESSQPCPVVGDTFEPEFTCLYDDDVNWNSMLMGNPQEKMNLVKTGLWSYQVFGKVVSVSNSGDECMVDCGCCLLPAPIATDDSSYIGRYIEFKVSRLSVWRA